MLTYLPRLTKKTAHSMRGMSHAGAETFTHLSSAFSYPPKAESTLRGKTFDKLCLVCLLRCTDCWPTQRGRLKP